MLIKSFHFDSYKDLYKSDACVIWCFDNRFEAVYRKFLKRMNIQFPDRIRIAGGAKALASPKVESEREFVLDQIRASMTLHGAEKVILMLHADCGAYRDLDAEFLGSPEREAAHHEAELQIATEVLSARIPSVDVESYFVDFTSVWRLAAT